MKKLTATLLALMLVLGLALCGGALAGEKADPQPIEGEIIVGYLAKNTVDAFHATLNNCARELLDGLKADGVIADWQFYDAQTDPSTQVSQLEDAVNNGCNFIVFLPVEAAGSDPVVTNCANYGIPCIPVNSYTESAAELATAYSGSDDVQAGEMMAEYVMAQIPDGGKWAHMMGVVGSSAQIDRGEGIKKHMTEEAGWELVGEYAAEWLAEKAVNFATDVITQHGEELKAIVCDNDDMSSAVQAYCNSIGREDIVCIGVDGNAGPLMMVKEGTLGATVFQDAIAQMTYAIDLIPYIIAGDNTTMEWWNDQIPFVLITQDNVDDYM